MVLKDGISQAFHRVPVPQVLQFADKSFHVSSDRHCGKLTVASLKEIEISLLYPVGKGDLSDNLFANAFIDIFVKQIKKYSVPGAEKKTILMGDLTDINIHPAFLFYSYLELREISVDTIHMLFEKRSVDFTIFPEFSGDSHIDMNHFVYKGFSILLIAT